MSRNPRVRFCQNNMLAASGTTLTESGSKTNFPVANLIDPQRYRQWVPAGTFVITTANQNLYVNDGANKTGVITPGTYTYATLATAAAAALNAVSSSWTCTYDFVGATYRFTIGRSAGTKTLRLTQTSNAAWDTLGYTQATDQTAYVADEIRCHTSEWIVIDLGVAKSPLAFIVIGPADQIFPLSTTQATVTLKGNNVNSFGSPQVSRSPAVEASGIYHWLDDLSDTNYRYWKYEFSDRKNPLGPAGFGMNIAYLGDYVTPLATNITAGFQWTIVDPSIVTESASGNLFFRRQTKYHRLDALRMENMTQADRLTLMAAYQSIGKTTPFFLALDPTLAISATAGEMTKYAVIDQMPQMTHVIYQLFSHGFTAREVC